MRKPTCETWFMEGLLKPDYHCILIEDDYRDLIEKLNYTTLKMKMNVYQL